MRVFIIVYIFGLPRLTKSNDDAQIAVGIDYQNFTFAQISLNFPKSSTQNSDCIDIKFVDRFKMFSPLVFLSLNTVFFVAFSTQAKFVVGHG